MPKAVRLSVVRSERAREEAKSVRRELYGRLRDIVDDAGDDIAGYAIVVWDKAGSNWSNLKGGAPIKTRMAPSFVHDALNQHVAVDLSQQEHK